MAAFDAELAAFVDDLYATNTAANGAGLAANQVGDPRAVFATTWWTAPPGIGGAS